MKILGLVLAFFVFAAEIGSAQNLGVVDRAVADAKAKGEKETSIPRWGTVPEPWPDHIDNFLGKYAFIVAEPVAIQTTHDYYKIETWTRLHVSETLHPQKYVSTQGPAAPKSPNPSSNDELWMHVEGGEMLIDGVKVHQEGGPQLQMGKQYLLVVLLQTKGTVAIPAAGEAGIFELIGGAQLKPLAATNIYDDLRNRGLIMLHALRLWLRYRALPVG